MKRCGVYPDGLGCLRILHSSAMEEPALNPATASRGRPRRFLRVSRFALRRRHLTPIPCVRRRSTRGTAMLRCSAGRSRTCKSPVARPSGLFLDQARGVPPQARATQLEPSKAPPLMIVAVPLRTTGGQIPAQVVRSTDPTVVVAAGQCWCRRGDLNPHGLFAH
jgi:hypothetical protein